MAVGCPREKFERPFDRFLTAQKPWRSPFDNWRPQHTLTPFFHPVFSV